MTEPDEHHFTAVVQQDDRWLRMHLVALPTELSDQLRRQRVRRVVGTINGAPFRLAVQSRLGGGERYLSVSRALLRAMGVRGTGAEVPVVLRPDPDPDRIELGDELTEVLAQDEAAAARFNGMTPGRQRGLAYYVTSAKRPETRLSRALTLAEKLRTHTLYGDLNPSD